MFYKYNAKMYMKVHNRVVFFEKEKNYFFTFTATQLFLAVYEIIDNF